jgi:hypothetical protein
MTRRHHIGQVASRRLVYGRFVDASTDMTYEM